MCVPFHDYSFIYLFINLFNHLSIGLLIHSFIYLFTHTYEWVSITSRSKLLLPRVDAVSPVECHDLSSFILLAMLLSYVSLPFSVYPCFYIWRIELWRFITKLHFVSYKEKQFVAKRFHSRYGIELTKLLTSEKAVLRPWQCSLRPSITNIINSICI